MPHTRRRMWTTLSILYLLALAGLAAYALHSSNALSLPVPNILSALALALPPLAGLALEASLSMTSSARVRPAAHIRPYVLQLVSAVFLIYEAVLATLAGSHLAPVGSLDCALRERWTDLFRSKNEGAIRAIQDQYNCCGLASPRDMAWPFPSASDHHGADACLVRFQRNNSCLSPWREAERRVAGLLLAIALGVFVWQVLFLYIGPDDTTPSWLPSTLRLPYDHEANGSRGISRRVEYLDDDNLAEEDSVAEEVRRLNDDSRLATYVEGERDRGPDHNNDWANQRSGT